MNELVKSYPISKLIGSFYWAPVLRISASGKRIDITDCLQSRQDDLRLIHTSADWTVAFPQRDRKFSISALMQSTAEDQCGKCE